MYRHPTPAAIEVRPVIGKNELAAFIDLPWTIYQDDPCWVPPLKLMERERLQPGTNPFFEHGQANFWLAWHAGRPVGRISAQIDRLAPEHRQGRTGHFGMLEAIDDAAVFAALVRTAEDWLRAGGIRHVMGPFNLSINQECGLLVNGFNTPPRLMMGHALPYYAGHLERLGYIKEKDLLAFILDVTVPFPPVIQKLLKRAGTLGRIKVRPVDLKNLDRDLWLIFDIFNDAWAENWGFIPWTDAEIAHVAKEMKPLIRPEINYIAEFDGEPMGFMVALPDLNEAIADLNGRLWPLGWAKLLWRLKFRGRLTASTRVPLMGIRRSYQGRPTGAYAAFMLIETIRHNGARIGARTAELSWMLEDNTALEDILLAINSKPYKTYRIYGKPLS